MRLGPLTVRSAVADSDTSYLSADISNREGGTRLFDDKCHVPPSARLVKTFQEHKWLTKDFFSLQFLLVLLMYLDRKLLPRFSGFQLYRKPEFKRTKNRLSAIFALGCTTVVKCIFSKYSFSSKLQFTHFFKARLRNNCTVYLLYQCGRISVDTAEYLSVAVDPWLL